MNDFETVKLEQLGKLF